MTDSWKLVRDDDRHAPGLQSADQVEFLSSLPRVASRRRRCLNDHWHPLSELQRPPTHPTSPEAEPEFGTLSVVEVTDCVQPLEGIRLCCIPLIADLEAYSITL